MSVQELAFLLQALTPYIEKGLVNTDALLQELLKQVKEE